MPKYFGKYRAFVSSVDDPQHRGRIKVKCPSVLGEYVSAWCEPCFPFSYERGGDFVLPKVNDFVWVEFEEGNPNKPIWVGSLCSIDNTPQTGSYRTDIRIMEFDGGRIEMDASQILIKIGSSSIKLSSSGNIDIVGGGSITINGSTVNLN